MNKTKSENLDDTLVGALARGYCTDRNSNKVVDPSLIEDMAVEVEKFLDNTRNDDREELVEPDTDFDFICEWFEKARNTAKEQGRNDSAKLWEDGLQHLRYYHSHFKPPQQKEK